MGRILIACEVNGLRGLMAEYTRELRLGLERRESTITDTQHALRCFLRWLHAHERRPWDTRVDPRVLSVSLLMDWWSWMLSPARVFDVPVERAGRTYTRRYVGPLRRSSAYKEWRVVVKFWRWAAELDEIPGAVPPCPSERLRKPYNDNRAPVGSRKPVKVSSWGEAARCVSLTPTWARPLAILLYYTGLRVAQARALTWDDVHLDGAHAVEHGGPVLWVGHGKTADERRGRFVPVHPDLADWLRQRRDAPQGPHDLDSDLRRVGTRAWRARVEAYEAGRIAWEVGDQCIGLQLGRAWASAGSDSAVWRDRTAHAFRKCFRTNLMRCDTVPGMLAWQAVERLIGHKLPGQIDVYQSDRVLMPTMRTLVASIPRWERAALRVEHGSGMGDNGGDNQVELARLDEGGA